MHDLLDLLEECTVRVTGPGHGTAFFVAPGLALTCAHVVAFDQDAVAPHAVQMLRRDGTSLTGSVDANWVFPHRDEDIAVIRVASAGDHPCVMLGEDAALDDAVRAHGFPDYKDDRGPRADGLRGRFESRTQLPELGGDAYFIKFTKTRVVGGFSGSPLLDLRTGVVIGVVTETLDDRIALGGWAIPTAFIAKRLPELLALNRAVHAANDRWERARRTTGSAGRRVPLMQGPLPRVFVPRHDLFRKVIKELLDDDGNPRPGTVALEGFGGFGKTTLAAEIARDAHVKSTFRDGILWVTLGEKARDLVATIADLIELLTGARRSFATLEAATTALREALSDRQRLLLVLDDVWQAADAQPFLDASARFTRLITTRDPRVLPVPTTRIELDAGMAEGESIALLTYEIADAGQVPLSVYQKWIGDLGRWPLLIALVNGALRLEVQLNGRPLPAAVSYVKEKLKQRGLTAFDSRNSSDRAEAVQATVGVSLELLTADERNRYRELVIFPAKIDIPLAAIVRLWTATSGLSAFDAEDLCSKLNALSLLAGFRAEDRRAGATVRLHDVLFTYLRDTWDSEALVAVHQAFLATSAPTSWAELPSDDLYLWEHLAHHLLGARRYEQLTALLFDAVWLQTKLRLLGLASVLSDYARIDSDPVAKRVEWALRLASVALDVEPLQLPTQLQGRLSPYANEPTIRQLLRDASNAGKATSFELVSQTLTPAGGAQLQTLTGHENVVMKAILALDETRIVSASWDLTARIWDANTGRELHRFQGQGNNPESLTTTHQGTLAIVGDADGTIRTWDIATGALGHTLVGHENYLTGLATSKDDGLLVSTAWDKTLRVWSMASGALLHTRELCRRAARHVDFASSDAFVVAVDADGPLLVLDTSTFEVRHTVGRDFVRLLATSKDEPIAVVSAGDHSMAVIDLDAGTILGRLAGHTDSVRCVVLMKDGDRAVSVGQDGSLIVWDLRRFALLENMTAGAKSLAALAVTPSGDRALSGGVGGQLNLWDINRGELLGSLPGHVHGIWSAAINADGQRAVTASGDRTIRSWDLSRAAGMSPSIGHHEAVFDVAIAANGTHAMSAGEDGTICMWDLANAELVRRFEGHTGRVMRLLLLADEQRMVSASADGTIRLWDIPTGGSRAFGSRSLETIAEIGLVEDPLRVVAASGKGTLFIWDLDAATLRSESHADLLLGEPRSKWIYDLSVSPDRRYALAAYDDGSILILDLVSGRERESLEAHERFATAVRFTPAGDIAISAGADGALRSWDTASWSPRATFVARGSPIQDISLTADGRLVVAASEDGAYRVWDIETGEPVKTLTATPAPRTRVAFVGTGTGIITQTPWALSVWSLDDARRLATFTADSPFMCFSHYQANGRLTIVAAENSGRVHILGFDYPDV